MENKTIGYILLVITLLISVCYCVKLISYQPSVINFWSIIGTILFISGTYYTFGKEIEK